MWIIVVRNKETWNRGIDFRHTEKINQISIIKIKIYHKDISQYRSNPSPAAFGERK
jgi:hypothetical protein